MKRIAVEEDFVTKESAQEWKRVLSSDSVEPGFRLMGASILGDDAAANSVHERLLDIGAGRIERMDADGIDLSILSITSPGVQVFDSDTTTRLASAANNVLAEARVRARHSNVWYERIFN